jgi:predicted N-acyltransferase
MRSPVPFIAPSLPVVASALIRDDVPLSDIAPEAWNALGHSQPFLSHAYLSALHETGCASPETGWSPHYLTAWRDGALVGALPLYAKAHSYGEYVFDWGWADAYRRYGRRYYPKWIVAVPFTPVPGPRVLADDAATRRDLLVQAIASVRDGGHSSLHVLFPTPAEAAEGEALGMIPRAGLQFHWTNPGYRDFADFLDTFAHDKRKKVKQERRRVAEAGVTFERRRGNAITSEDWDFFYRRYQQTYREHQSTPYLTRDFFERIGAALPDNMLLVIGSRNGRRICAALGLHDGETLWGRYWGTREFRLRPALRSLLLPVHRVLHRAAARAVRRRSTGRAQARTRAAAGRHAFAARHRRSRLCIRHRRLLRARTRRHRAHGRRTRGGVAVQASSGSLINYTGALLPAGARP